MPAGIIPDTSGITYIFIWYNLTFINQPVNDGHKPNPYIC